MLLIVAKKFTFYWLSAVTHENCMLDLSIFLYQQALIRYDRNIVR